MVKPGEESVFDMKKSVRHFCGALLVLVCAYACAQELEPTTPATAESALGAVHEAVKKRLDAEGRAGLESAQSAWEAFRVAECTFRTQWTEGGSIRPQLLQSCRAQLAQERVAQLKYFLTCEEGDLTCPPTP
jgi:uncharacterized protein YecT (DUF1311 family)